LRFSGSVNESTVRGGSNDDEIIKEEDWRGHIFGEGRIALKPHWRSGFNMRRVRMIIIYVISTTAIWTSLRTIFMQKTFNGRNYGTINAYYFQDLRPDISSEQPDILPWIKYNA
jgi:LPS-assembly protein